MKLRWLFILGLPLIVFAGVVGVVMALSAGDRETAAASPSISVNLSAMPPQDANAQSPVPPSPSPAPTATPANRASCASIRGTTYLSSEERAWYIEYCPAPTPVPRVVSAPTSIQPSANLYGTSDRFVMQRLGINAPVNVSVVGPDGTMGNPLGGNDVVLYDFSAIPGLGGYPGGGNTVIAGHIDYICCLAVFAPLRYVEKGDVIDYYTGDGGLYQYVVEWFGDYPPDTNWASIVSGGPDIMTLITCNGTFDPVAREYSHRRVVRAVRVSS